MPSTCKLKNQKVGPMLEFTRNGKVSVTVKVSERSIKTVSTDEFEKQFEIIKEEKEKTT